MTARTSEPCDVFISHAIADANLARYVARDLKSAGLSAFHAGSVQPGTDVSDAIWQALAESRALIAIVSPDIPTHANGLVEIGAAAAWEKPIYLLLNGPSSTKLPPGLGKYPAYPKNRLEDIISAILSSFEPLSEEECNVLASLYQDTGVSADQLNQPRGKLHELTARFNRTTGKHLSGERLLSEIWRMRKRRTLPRLRRAKRPA